MLIEIEGRQFRADGGGMGAQTDEHIEAVSLAKAKGNSS